MITPNSGRLLVQMFCTEPYEDAGGTLWVGEWGGGPSREPQGAVRVENPQDPCSSEPRVVLREGEKALLRRRSRLRGGFYAVGKGPRTFTESCYRLYSLSASLY